MTLVVTGAGGFVGRNLLPELGGLGRVVGLIRPGKTRGIGQEMVEVDLAEPIDFGRLPDRADVVVHLAQANVSFPDDAKTLFAVNALSTQRLLDYAREAGVSQFILASSGDVYGDRTGFANEDDPVRPTSFYGMTKATSEMLVQSYERYLQPTILRLYRPYGPGQTGRLVPNLANAVLGGRTIGLNEGCRPMMTPTYIDDVTRVIVSAIEQAVGGIYNVAGDDEVSVRDLAELLGHLIGQDPIFESTGSAVGDACGDNSRMKRYIDSREPTGLQAGLQSMLEDTTCLTES